MAWDKGFNFRATSGYVTDGTDETYVVFADAYPVTRNGVTFGWEDVGTFDTRDRSVTPDRRLAGMHFQPNDGNRSRFRVDLPSAGSYTVRLAIGDWDNGQAYCYYEALDTTASLFIVDDTNGTSLLHGFDDATGTEYTDVNWPGSNTAVSITAATTILRIRIGSPGVQTANTCIAHLFVSQVAAPSGGWLRYRK